MYLSTNSTLYLRTFVGKMNRRLSFDIRNGSKWLKSNEKSLGDEILKYFKLQSSNSTTSFILRYLSLYFRIILRNTRIPTICTKASTRQLQSCQFIKPHCQAQNNSIFPVLLCSNNYKLWFIDFSSRTA